MIRRTFLLIWVEGKKLFHQRLPYLGLVLVGLLVVGQVRLSVRFEEDRIEDDREGGSPSLRIPSVLHYAAKGSSVGFQVSAVLLLILGALALSREATEGTLRVLLIRPVRRSEVLLAKGLALAGYGIFLVLFCGGLSVAASWLFLEEPSWDLSTEVGGVKQVWQGREGPVLSAYFLRTLGVSCLPVLVAGFLGLFISVWVDNAGVAVGSAILIGLPCALLGQVVGLVVKHDWHEWIPTRYLGYTVGILEALAVGRADIPQGWGDLGMSLLVPTCYLLILFAASFLVFRHKDILS